MTAAPARPRVLFIAHRIPFPPHKGDKLRAYHLLRGLALHCDVTLAAVIDDPADRSYTEEFGEIGVRKVLTGDLRGRSLVTSGLRALMAEEPVTFTHFREAGLMKAIAAEPAPDLVYVYSSGAAPYLEAVRGTPKIITDFVDIDSEKWAEMARKGKGPMKRVHEREARLLLREETRIAGLSARSLLVSDHEAAMFREMTGVEDGVLTLENGVDAEYWAEGAEMPRPYPQDGRRRVIMTGAMDYPPNIEAALWFVNVVLPHRGEREDIEFVIAGANPAPALCALEHRADIRLTRRVPDMRPFLAHADIAVAPLRLARGIQNKVLEAMASETPVIATAAAATGIDAEPARDLFIADNPTHMAALVDRVLADPVEAKGMTVSARMVIETRYTWNSRFNTLHEIVDQVLTEGDADVCAA